MPNATRYVVRREFTGGMLKGLEYTEFSDVALPLGFVSKAPHLGSPFTITGCIALAAGWDCETCRKYLKDDCGFDSAAVDGWNDCQVAKAYMDYEFAPA